MLLEDLMASKTREFI